MKEIDSIELLGVRIHSLSVDELNQCVTHLIGLDKKHVISHVNIHGMNIAHKKTWYKNFLNDASINFCDGDGVRLIAKLVDKHIKQKITYNRWIWDLAALSQQHGFSWYMLGATEDSIEKSHQKLVKKYPKLNITGYRNGYMDGSEELDRTILHIKACSPDILIVGMGMPLQENFLMQNMNSLSFKVAFTAGAVFDYVSGRAAMTPNIYYKLKLEWLYRLMQEPKRLAKRYLIGNPAFLLRVLRNNFF